MVHSASSLQFRQLRASTDDDAYKLYRAALEWDLDDPIVIEDRNDLKSEASWRKSLEPFDHQVTNLITFCRRLPVTLLADDVGLGKTISAGLVASELISRGRVSRILIVCPKLLMPQWKAELATKFNIPSIGRMVDDGKLPQPLRLGTHQTSRTVWWEHEVEAAMQALDNRDLRPE